MERPHGELGSGLTDRLGGDDADRLTDLDRQAGSQVEAVAIRAAAAIAFTGEHGADLEPLLTDALDGLGLLLVDDIIHLDDDFTGNRVLDFLAGHAAVDAAGERGGLLVTIHDGGNVDAVGGAAVLTGDDHVLGHVHEFAGHVAGVRSLERGVGETLAGAVGGDEVFQHRKTFAEVGNDRALDNLAGRFGHQAAHAAELLDLGLVTPRAGIDHHEQRRSLVLAIVVLDFAVERIGDRVGRLGPDVHDLLVALAIGDHTVAVLLGDLFDLFVGLGDDLLLLLGDHHIDDTDGSAGTGGFLETEGLEVIEHLDGINLADCLVAAPDDLADFLLADVFIDEADASRPDLVETDAAGSGLDDLAFTQRGFERSEFLAVLVAEFLALVSEDGVLAEVRVAQADPLVVAHLAGSDGKLDLRGVFKQRQVFGLLAVLGGADGRPGKVVGSQNDVLRGHRDRAAGGRREDVVRSQHELAALHLGLHRERHVDGHLVAVEVRVVGGADERVDADGLALDEFRLERLDRETVQRGSTVEQDRVALGDFREDVPDLGGLAVDHLLGAAHGVAVAELLETADDEGLEQGERHLLGKTALAELEVGADHDDGAAGVIDALAEQVLAETAALALEHVGEGLERTVAGTGDGAAVAAVVEERVNGFLKHPLFVADDDLRRLEEQEVLEAVVAVDDAAVEVVEIGGGETAAFEGNERTKVRRDHGQHRLDHPFRAGFGSRESLADLEALAELLLVLLRTGSGEFLLKFHLKFGEVDLLEQLLDRLGTHGSLERAVAVGVFGFAEFVLGEELAEFERGVAGLGDDVILVVDHALKLAGAHVEHQADARRHALVEPDVGNRHGQFDVAHALAAHAAEGHFHTAAVADDTLVLDALVFAAGALPVTGGPEDPLAEEAAFFRFEGAVVDGFRVLHLALGPGADDVRGSDGDRDLVEGLGALVHAEKFAKIVVNTHVSRELLDWGFACLGSEGEVIEGEVVEAAGHA